jgi:hypothetical protein
MEDTFLHDFYIRVDWPPALMILTAILSVAVILWIWFRRRN